MGDPKDDLSAVPLFPLPNVVLFPRAVLPLHVFEERYKEMTADALTGNRQIAMALLCAGWETNYHGKPPIEPIVCVGTILSHEKLPDGRYNFLLQGHTRARIVREFGDQAYRLAELRPLAETTVMEIDLDDERRRLAAVFENERLLATGIGRKFRELFDCPIATAELADLIAYNFLEDIRLKQMLLADGDVRRRVRLTTKALEAFQCALHRAAPLASGMNPGLN